jgi:hypothetical protein
MGAPAPSGERDAPPATIRVVIADDSYLVRQALAHVLDGTSASSWSPNAATRSRS